MQKCRIKLVFIHIIKDINFQSERRTNCVELFKRTVRSFEFLSRDSLPILAENWRGLRFTVVARYDSLR